MPQPPIFNPIAPEPVDAQRPTAPDFDQIAIALAIQTGRSDGLPQIREALRLVWNARGAADVAHVMDTEARMAIRDLDR